MAHESQPGQPDKPSATLNAPTANAPTANAPTLGPHLPASAHAAMGALDSVRASMMESLESLHAELQQARRETAEAEHELSRMREAHDLSCSQLGQIQQERDALREQCVRSQQHEQEQAVLAQQAASEARRHETRARELEGELQARARRADELQRSAETERGRAEAERRRGVELRQKLAELHADLAADDVPTLILRVAMHLTEAEAGLFVDDSGRHALAAIGLDDMKDFVSDALFDFTEQALREDTPVVRNDAEGLPDGSDLVNLAALPVTVQSDDRSAILVANKRSGAFTDEDTELLISIGRHAGIAMENQRLHCQLAEAYVGTVAVLADAIEAKDPYTRGHCESVSRLAVSVAEQLGASGRELEELRYAALLHDVGKIGVSDGILLKPGKLQPEEYQLIQKHSTIGSDLVKRVPALEAIAPLILHHHERIDGTGYPNGLSADDIPMGARIIGAVDALDAMTTPRPYRDAIGLQQALSELRRCAGSQFDPQVVEIIERTLAEREGDGTPFEKSGE